MEQVNLSMTLCKSITLIFTDIIKKRFNLLFYSLLKGESKNGCGIFQKALALPAALPLIVNL